MPPPDWGVWHFVVMVGAMLPAEIVQHIVARWGSAVVTAFAEDKHPRVYVNAEHWSSIARWLHDEPTLQFDWLANLSGLDYAADDRLAVVYDLWSFSHRHRVAVKVFTPRSSGHIPSVVNLWPAANWHEREAFDLLGIHFDGHPHLCRILLADDWEGHPLRKDYVFPREVHGIPASVELDWQQGH